MQSLVIRSIIPISARLEHNYTQRFGNAKNSESQYNANWCKCKTLQEQSARVLITHFNDENRSEKTTARTLHTITPTSITIQHRAHYTSLTAHKYAHTRFESSTMYTHTQTILTCFFRVLIVFSSRRLRAFSRLLLFLFFSTSSSFFFHCSQRKRSRAILTTRTHPASWIRYFCFRLLRCNRKSAASF